MILPAAGVQERRETMELHEMLKLCLLALDSRFPESYVEVNGTLLGYPGFRAEACSSTAMLEVLRLYAPELLLTPACLVIEPGAKRDLSRRVVRTRARVLGVLRRMHPITAGETGETSGEDGNRVI